MPLRTQHYPTHPSSFVSNANRLLPPSLLSAIPVASIPAYCTEVHRLFFLSNSTHSSPVDATEPPSPPPLSQQSEALSPVHATSHRRDVEARPTPQPLQPGVVALEAPDAFCFSAHVLHTLKKKITTFVFLQNMERSEEPRLVCSSSRTFTQNFGPNLQ